VDAPPEDEELPGSQRPPMGRRVPTGSGGLALALVVAAGVVLADRPHHERDVARPAPSSSANPSAATSAVTSAATSVAISSPPAPPCLDVGGSRLSCGVTATLPAPTVHALQAALPGATVLVASTVVGRNGRVYSRRATVRDALGTTLRIRIGPPSGQGGEVVRLNALEAAVMSYTVDVGRHRVELSVLAGTGRTSPSPAVLRRLARDPRLIVP
jgi:hypothetical protein